MIYPLFLNICICILSIVACRSSTSIPSASHNSFMCSGMGRSLVSRLPSNTKRETCATFLSSDDGKFAENLTMICYDDKFLILQQSDHDERSPLVGPYFRSYAASHMGGESSIANFYSPIESMNNSDEEDDKVS